MKEPFDRHFPVKCRKTRWILCRLKRRGYHLNRQQNGDMGITFAFLPPNDWSPYDSCHLMLTIQDGDWMQTKVTFRPNAECDIHVSRYLQLFREDGWKRLEEFESFYRQHHYWLTRDDER